MADPSAGRFAYRVEVRAEHRRAGAALGLPPTPRALVLRSTADLAQREHRRDDDPVVVDAARDQAATDQTRPTTPQPRRPGGAGSVGVGLLLQLARVPVQLGVSPPPPVGPVPPVRSAGPQQRS